VIQDGLVRHHFYEVFTWLQRRCNRGRLTSTLSRWNRPTRDSRTWTRDGVQTSWVSWCLCGCRERWR